MGNKVCLQLFIELFMWPLVVSHTSVDGPALMLKLAALNVLSELFFKKMK